MESCSPSSRVTVAHRFDVRSWTRLLMVGRPEVGAAAAALSCGAGLGAPVDEH